MLLARRLYLYFIAGVSLIALAIGLSNLLELAIGALRDAPGGSALLSGDDDAIRRQLSIHAAVTIVALPIWLLHWWLAERQLHGADREVERASAARALYLTAALGGSLLAGAIATTRLVQSSARWIIDTDRSNAFDDVDRWLAPALVAAAVWLYHGSIRRRDMRGGPLADEADWLPRLYVYAAAFTGIALAAFAVGDLLALVVESLTTTDDVMFASGAWDGLLASSIARALVGIFIWVAHWQYSLRLVAADDWRGDHARASALRRFYGYAVAFGAVTLTLILVTRTGEALLTTILDATPANAEPFARRVFDPIVRVIPFVGAWIYHRQVVLAEAIGWDEGKRQATVRRVYIYAIALIGLAMTGIGISGLIAASLDRIAVDDSILSITGSSVWRLEVARLVSLSLVGVVAWLWHWNIAQGWRRTDPAIERATTVRRAYVFATIAATIVALLVSLAIVIYRILAEVLNVEVTDGLLDELSQPIGILVVASTLLIYHAALLRADLGAAETPTVASETETVIRLVVTGPPGADADEVVASIQAHVPEGYVVRALPRSD